MEHIMMKKYSTDIWNFFPNGFSISKMRIDDRMKNWQFWSLIKFINCVKMDFNREQIFLLCLKARFFNVHDVHV